MKKSRLIKRSDRIVDVTAGSPISHTSVCVLWQHILAMRNMYHVTVCIQRTLVHRRTRFRGDNCLEAKDGKRSQFGSARLLAETR